MPLDCICLSFHFLFYAQRMGCRCKSLTEISSNRATGRAAQPPKLKHHRWWCMVIMKCPMLCKRGLPAYKKNRFNTWLTSCQNGKERHARQQRWPVLPVVLHDMSAKLSASLNRTCHLDEVTILQVILLQRQQTIPWFGSQFKSVPRLKNQFMYLVFHIHVFNQVILICWFRFDFRNKIILLYKSV